MFLRSSRTLAEARWRKVFLHHRGAYASPAPLCGYPIYEERRLEKCHVHTSKLRSPSAVTGSPLWQALRIKAVKNCIPSMTARRNPTPKRKASFTPRSYFRLTLRRSIPIGIHSGSLHAASFWHSRAKSRLTNFRPCCKTSVGSISFPMECVWTLPFTTRATGIPTRTSC